MINKKIHLLALTVILGAAASAQSIQDGVKALYEGKVLGAKSIFEKQADKPEATYWLVRADVENQDKKGAQAALDKALAAKPNEAWLLAAKGYLQLLDNKANEAKQSFESALTASKGRRGNDPEILNAVGGAIATEYNNIDKVGDINYAVQKLEEAKSLTAEKSKDNFFKADILTNLGDAYRKAFPGDGTKAYGAYSDANMADPTFAKAFLKTAMIFKSQRNYDLFLQNLDKATAADPAYVPAYEALYEYKIGTFDFNSANQVADKIIAHSDPSPWNEYYKAQTFYLNKQYDQAIASGNGILQKMGDQVKPKLYRLLAWSYVDKGDAKDAQPFMEKFFATVNKDDITPSDYNLKATVYSAVPGKEAEVAKAFDEGLKADTTVAGRVKILEDGAKFFGDKKQYGLQGDLLAKLIEIKPTPTINDYFNAGYRAYYQGKEYEKSWKVFDRMRTKFPDVNYGYLWAFRNSKVFDSANAKNVMIPDGEKLIAFSQKDTAKDAKANTFEAATTMATYYVNVASDKDNGLKYLTIARDAAPDDATKQQLQGFIDQVSKMAAKPAGSKAQTGAAPAQGQGASKKDSASNKPKSPK
ncbi:MAG: hypothetical protein J7539_08840 [Niabella sp.]|nr:hypothetical protein [Niabella sp.]